MIRPKGIWTSRVVVAALVLAFSAVSASAYTIVMRDGRRVSIPDEFTVTNSTVTYEVGSGVQISIQLASVNVAATERANGEASGAFLARANAQPQPAAPAAPGASSQGRSKADRSITNADLEGYRRARLASERAYEQRRKQLGLPSREQQRLDMAAVEARTQAQLRNMRSQDQSGEAYWRERAGALRSEVAVNDAQIEFVRVRLSEIPETNSPFDTNSPFGYPTANGPFGYPGSNYPVWNPFPGNRRSNRVYNRRFPRGQWPVFIPPAQNDRSEERATLTNQLNDLLMQRAALGVRWKELEEEARRAGAYPGWLRP